MIGCLCRWPPFGFQVQGEPSQNAVAPDWLEALDLQLELAASLMPWKKLRTPFLAPIGALDRRDRIDQLEIGSAHPEVRIDIPLVDGGYSPVNDLQVLLRHRPHSIRPKVRISMRTSTP